MRRCADLFQRGSAAAAISLSFVSLLLGCKSPGPAEAPTRSGLIAFTLATQTAARVLQIFTANLDGSDRRQLTFERDSGRPDWAPDGSRIAFETFRSPRKQVSVMNADGSNQRILADGEAPDWSADGQRIAFSRDGQVWTMDADGSRQTNVTSSSTFKSAPSWSPDGRQMVFILLRNPTSPTDPQPEIGIMNSDGTNERILTAEDRTNVHADDTTAPAANANAPAWSPVGNKIAFWSGIEGQYGQIWLINADGTGSRQLTEDPSRRNSDDPSWSPDGTKILFSTGRSGRNELWVMDADGANERRVFDIDAFPSPGRASWQPATELGGSR